MLVRPRNVTVYKQSSGSAPFDDYMENLKDMSGGAAIDSRIALLRRGSLGKDYEDIGDGLIELKIKKVGPGYRIYVADDGVDTLILWAGSKRTQNKDIKQAKAYWADHKARKE